MVFIVLYIPSSSSFDTSISSEGVSVLYARKESSCNLTVNGFECEASSVRVVVSADVCSHRAPIGCERETRRTTPRQHGWKFHQNEVNMLGTGTYELAGQTGAHPGERGHRFGDGEGGGVVVGDEDGGRICRTLSWRWHHSRLPQRRCSLAVGRPARAKSVQFSAHDQ